MKIIEVRDNGGKTADRYTVVFDEKIYMPTRILGEYVAEYTCLSLSSDCHLPNGVSMWGTTEKGAHLGRRISFEKLPANVKRCVRSAMGKPVTISPKRKNIHGPKSLVPKRRQP